MIKSNFISLVITCLLCGCGATVERGVNDSIVVIAKGDSEQAAMRKAQDEADKICHPKNQIAINIKGTTKAQWDLKTYFVAEMVYQCGQNTKKLSDENSEKYLAELNIPELEILKGKVQFDRRLTPTASMISNESYPNSDEKLAIRKWIQLREEYERRARIIFSKEVKFGLIYELRTIQDKTEEFGNQLLLALYNEQITFAEYGRKIQEIRENVSVVVRELNFKFSEKSYLKADEEAMRMKLVYQAQQISRDSVNYFEALTKKKPVKPVAKSQDNPISPIESVKVKNKLDSGKLVLRQGADSVAIIIGIQNYKRLAKADFADQDAMKFADYANRALGIPKEKIKILIDAEADQSALLKTFRNWLPLNVNKGKTEVFVFYSGHGLPSNDGKSLYFLPHAADQDLLDETAIDQKKIIAAIQSTQPKSVTMFVDSCYSGQSRNGVQLLAGAKPVNLKNSDIGYPPEFTVFTASASDQISSASNDLQHGIFSFYLMKGMEGAADINKDGNITYGEMQQYLSENVQRQALAANRVQVPQLIGDPNRVLVGR